MSALRQFDTLRARSRAAHDQLHHTDHAGTDHEVGGSPWTDLRREIARARRFTRPFTIVRIDRPRGAGGWLAYGRALGSSIRSIDAMWEADDAIYLLLPESDRDAGLNFVQRLRAEMPALVPVQGVAVASFPDDGLTSGALLEHLAREGRLDVLERPELVAAPTPFESPVAHAHSG